MAVCRFCGQEFGNRQGVRAHLKACPAYLGRFTRQPAIPQADDDLPNQTAYGAPVDSLGVDLDPVAKMRQQVTTEKLRLKLREVQQAHEALDADEEARRRAAAEVQARETGAQAALAREREAARARASQEAQARREVEIAKERRKAKRREVIQEVKRVVFDDWSHAARASSEVKAQVLRAIESALSSLPVDELPQSELVQIAEAARDRVYGQITAAQAAEAARAQQCEALRQYGIDYARQELDDAEDLDWSERWRIESVVAEELKGLTGNESRAQVRAWVEDILDEEGLYRADEDDAE